MEAKAPNLLVAQRRLTPKMTVVTLLIGRGGGIGYLEAQKRLGEFAGKDYLINAMSNLS